MLVATCLIIPQHMRLSGTIIEIWHLKDNGVMTLTFWSHMMSSVTWSFDSRWSTSYGWSTVTMRLSGTITEIWPFEGSFRKGGRLVGWSSILHCNVACKE